MHNWLSQHLQRHSWEALWHCTRLQQEGTKLLRIAPKLHGYCTKLHWISLTCAHGVYGSLIAIPILFWQHCIEGIAILKYCNALQHCVQSEKSRCRWTRHCWAHIALFWREESAYTSHQRQIEDQCVLCYFALSNYQLNCIHIFTRSLGFVLMLVRLGGLQVSLHRRKNGQASIFTLKISNIFLPPCLALLTYNCIVLMLGTM